MRRRPGPLVLGVALAAGLVLAGCSEADREGIVDAVESALDATGTDEPTATATTTEAPPTTEAPTTTEAPPTTEAPAATEAPTTEAPPEETAAATEPTEPSSEVATEEEAPDDGLEPWVWVVIGVVLLLLAWAIIAAMRRRRRAIGRVRDLRESAVAETDWLLSVAREHPSAADAVGRARDVRVRLDRLTETLQELRAVAGAEITAVAADLHDSTRQLADALVARLDDAAEHRRDDEGLGLPALVDRVTRTRDRLISMRPRPR